MAQVPPIEDAYIDDIIKSAEPYNPELDKTQGVKLRELIKRIRDRFEQESDLAIHTTGDETKAGHLNLSTGNLTIETGNLLITAGGINAAAGQTVLGGTQINSTLSVVGTLGVNGVLTTASLDNYQVDLSASYTTRSKVDKGYVTGVVSTINTSINGKINSSEKGANNGVATLGADGKIPATQIPSIAVTNTFVVASQAAMLAVSGADVGDIAVRTDVKKSFILQQTPATTLANWVELLTPTDLVQSVNGQTGVVNLTTTNVAEGTNLYFTSARALASVISTFAVGANSTVTTADTIETAIEKLQAQVNNRAPLIGTGASGTWGISITGNAATATTLQNARTLWGQSFNGSANISGALSGVTNIAKSGLVEQQFNVGSSGLMVFENVKHFLSNDNSLPGNIKIILPIANGNSTMFWMKVTIFEYATTRIRETMDLTISGYSEFSNATVWCNIPNRVLQVRFGHDGTNRVIWIDTPSNFSYPKVIIKEFGVSHVNSNAAVLKDPGNYSISITEDETGYVNVGTVTNAEFKRDLYYQPAIPAGTSAQYYRGDKTWQSLNTAVLASILTGFAVGTNSAITASDSIIVALGKVQSQINARPGTVTSVGMTLPTGLAVTPSSIATSGTFAITYAAGYAIPTTAKQTQWDTAFTNNHTHANKAFLDTITSGATINLNVSGNAGTVTNGVYTTTFNTLGDARYLMSGTAHSVVQKILLNSTDSGNGGIAFQTTANNGYQMFVSKAGGAQGIYGNLTVNDGSYATGRLFRNIIFQDYGSQGTEGWVWGRVNQDYPTTVQNIAELTADGHFFVENITTHNLNLNAGVIYSAPQYANDIVNKAYVDSAVSSISGYLPLTGGVLTGSLDIIAPLVVHSHAQINGNVTSLAAPTNASHLTNKAYVDNAIGSVSGYLPLTGGQLSGQLRLALDGVSSLGHAPVQVTRSLAENWAYFGLSRDGQGQWSIGQSTNNELLFGGAPSGVITNISFKLDGWGNMYIPGKLTAAGGGGTSDIRHKNLTGHSLDLSWLDVDRTISFKWKDETIDKDFHYGYSAQEVMEWFPDLVFRSNPDHLYLNQTELLILEVKRLKQRVTELESGRG